MNTLLSMLYKGFEVERASPAIDVKERFGFTMRPDQLKVRLKVRASQRRDCEFP